VRKPIAEMPARLEQAAGGSGGPWSCRWRADRAAFAVEQRDARQVGRRHLAQFLATSSTMAWKSSEPEMPRWML
jgi:hypothetical protein